MSTLTFNRFEWGVVFAGSVVATALTIVLMQFGSVISLSADTPLTNEGSLAAWQVIATGIWILWVQLLASLAGGYSAGYLRSPTPDYKPHVNELHDGIYGLAVWATSTIAIFLGAAAAAAVGVLAVAETDVTETINALTDAEQNTAIIFAFATGATSLLSAVAAWWASTMGGEHRSKNTDFSQSLSFKK